jgi:hypothetical protein
MTLEGFSERRGARPVSADVSRVAIVITDGRSQDNVTEPAKAARERKVNIFAIGVTDHVLAAELEAIAGRSPAIHHTICNNSNPFYLHFILIYSLKALLNAGSMWTVSRTLTCVSVQLSLPLLLSPIK